MSEHAAPSVEAVSPRPSTRAATAAPPTPDGPGRTPDCCSGFPAILYIADAGESGRWHYVSPQIEVILGFTPEEWCADPTLWARSAASRRRERVLAGEIQRSWTASPMKVPPSTACCTATATSSGCATTRCC